MADDTLTATNLFDVLRNLVYPEQPLPEDFPQAEWDRWRQIYQKRWSYFTGQHWEQQTTTGKSKVDKFPLRINPIKTFSLKHAYVLFGEIPDNGSSLARTRIVPNSSEDSDKVIADDAEKALERIYYENNMRSLMMENGILSQFLGGCVFKVSKALPDPLMPSGVRIERILPDYFWGEPDGSNMWNLRQAWVISPITVKQAREVYGVSLGLLMRDDQQTQMIEHWTRDRYRVSINGQTAKGMIADGTRVPMEGANPYGVVPFVYIPHERTGSFQGLSIIENISAVAEELNSRAADAGDALREESRIAVWFKNTPAGVKFQELFPGIMGINLGTQPAGAGESDMGVLEKPKLTSEMTSFLAGLYEQMRRDGFVPPVADGEDEGSQRSALTLAFRMWPLTSHIRSERQFWTDGLNLLAEMALICLVYANANRLEGETVPVMCSKIGKQHCGHMKAQKWFPMIPRDREQLVNELILRAGVNHVSPEKALEEYGDVDDIAEQVELILAWMKKINDMEVKTKAPATKLNAPVAASVTE